MPKSCIWRLARASLALVRIDRGEGDQNVVVLGTKAGDILVQTTAKAALAFGIDGKDAGNDAARTLTLGGLRYSGQHAVDTGAIAELSGHPDLEFIVAAIASGVAGLIGIGVDIDRPDLRKIYHPLSSAKPCRAVCESEKPVCVVTTIAPFRP